MRGTNTQWGVTEANRRSLKKNIDGKAARLPQYVVGPTFWFHQLGLANVVLTHASSWLQVSEEGTSSDPESHNNLIAKCQIGFQRHYRCKHFHFYGPQSAGHPRSKNPNPRSGGHWSRFWGSITETSNSTRLQGVSSGRQNARRPKSNYRSQLQNNRIR